jgi:HD-GYP domain-containing protein (c-di-GMP phosphodiesterase class II)
MSHNRPYRASLGIEAALEQIEIGKGKLFDIDVVDACLKLFRQDRYQFPII